MRTRGSVRFEPYWKVQWFDEVSMAWRDIQQAHPSEAAARAAFIDGRHCRVMAITELGRQAVA
jgi:4'-phosphopantetheinyl transferase EntD